MANSPPEIEVGESYIPLFNNEIRDKFILVEGRRGTAKTRSILTHVVLRALAQPKTRWFLARSTRTRLSETVLATLEEQVLPLFGMKPPKGGRENRWDYKLPGGSVLIPLALDDPARSQSAEFSGGYIAEVTELESANDVLAMAGTLRHKGVDYFQVIGDCNPGPPNHWANKIAQDAGDELRTFSDRAGYDRMLAYNAAPAQEGKWKRIITTPFDNPGYFDSMTWKWTKLGQTYYDGLKHLAGHMRARWLNGLWVAAEGGVFPEFGQANIVAPFAAASNWTVDCFCDPGTDHPCGIVWIATSPQGVHYTVDEVLQSGMGVKEVAAIMKRREEKWKVRRYYGDPRHVNSRTFQSTRTIIEQFGDYGINMQAWPVAAGSAGKESAVALLREEVIGLRWKVFSSCQETIGQFQSWRYKRNAKGEMLSGDDQYEDKSNDLMDPSIGAAAAKLKPMTDSPGGFIGG